MSPAHGRISESKINAYDRIAPVYDILCRLVFGKSIFQSQQWQVDFVPPEASILILGGGTGWLLEKLLRERPSCDITYLEASQGMIAKARERFGAHEVTFIHGRLGDLPEKRYDVIIANFFLDQFGTEDLRFLLMRLSGALNADGLLIVADFVDDARWKRVFLRVMYGFFNLIGAVAVSALAPWERLVREQGFQVTASSEFYNGFIRSAVYRKR